MPKGRFSSRGALIVLSSFHAEDISSQASGTLHVGTTAGRASSNSALVGDIKQIISTGGCSTGRTRLARESNLPSLVIIGRRRSWRLLAGLHMATPCCGLSLAKALAILTSAHLSGLEASLSLQHQFHRHTTARLGSEKCLTSFSSGIILSCSFSRNANRISIAQTPASPDNYRNLQVSKGLRHHGGNRKIEVRTPETT
jgi:hypothetical protein